MRRLANALLTASLLVSATPAIAQAQAPAVGTIRVSGTWTVNGRVVTNDTAPAYDGALVRIVGNPAAERRRAAHVIVYYSVAGQDPMRCEGSDACANGFTIRAHGVSDPLLARILAYFHPQAEPDLAVARGSGQVVPDGIIRRTGTSFDLQSLLDGVTAGTYQLVVTTRGAAPAVVASHRLTIGSAPIAVDVPGAADGLYALQLFDPATLQPATNAAWFAAEAPPAYDARRLAFDRALAATRTWSATPQNRAAADTLLRGLVTALADPAWQP